MNYVSKIFVTVDIALLKVIETNYFILLIKRKNEPFKDKWALPGGFVDENEALEVAAMRELLEETSIKCLNLAQVGAYGKPNRDPRGHMVSIAYMGEVASSVEGKAADDAKELAWFKITEIPDLAFDHLDIINDVLKQKGI